MSAENKPTRKFLNSLTNKYIVGNIDDEFLGRTQEERLLFIKNIATELELDEKNLDLEGLSEIPAEDFTDFLRKALKKYPEHKPFPFPSPSEGLNR